MRHPASVLRAARTRTSAALAEWRPVRRTALRDVYEHRLPATREFARFGDGSWLVPPCEVIGPGAVSIGEAVIVLEHASLRVIGDHPGPPVLVLDDGVRLARFVTIVCEVSVHIGKGVLTSDAVTVLDTWRDHGPLGAAPGGLPLPPPSPVRVEDGAYLGYGCTIGPGVRVGSGAFVGEGAVVLDDVPDHAVVYGNPALLTRRYDEASASWSGERWP